MSKKDESSKSAAAKASLQASLEEVWQMQEEEHKKSMKELQEKMDDERKMALQRIEALHGEKRALEEEIRHRDNVEAKLKSRIAELEQANLKLQDGTAERDGHIVAMEKELDKYATALMIRTVELDEQKSRVSAYEEAKQAAIEATEKIPDEKTSEFEKKEDEDEEGKFRLPPGETVSFASGFRFEVSSSGESETEARAPSNESETEGSSSSSSYAAKWSTKATRFSSASESEDNSSPKEIQLLPESSAITTLKSSLSGFDTDDEYDEWWSRTEVVSDASKKAGVDAWIKSSVIVQKQQSSYKKAVSDSSKKAVVDASIEEKTFKTYAKVDASMEEKAFKAYEEWVESMKKTIAAARKIADNVEAVNALAESWKTGKEVRLTADQVNDRCCMSTRCNAFRSEWAQTKRIFDELSRLQMKVVDDSKSHETYEAHKASLAGECKKVKWETWEDTKIRLAKTADRVNDFLEWHENFVKGEKLSRKMFEDCAPEVNRGAAELEKEISWRARRIKKRKIVTGLMVLGRWYRAKRGLCICPEEHKDDAPCATARKEAAKPQRMAWLKGARPDDTVARRVQCLRLHPDAFNELNSALCNYAHEVVAKYMPSQAEKPVRTRKASTPLDSKPGPSKAPGASEPRETRASRAFEPAAFAEIQKRLKEAHAIAADLVLPSGRTLGSFAYRPLPDPIPKH